MADIASITLPNGENYNFKDLEGRETLSEFTEQFNILENVVQDTRSVLEDTQKQIDGKIYVLTEDTTPQEDVDYYQLVLTYEIYPVQDGDNPQDLGLYVYSTQDDEYYLTTDTSPVDGQTYYQQIQTYEIYNIQSQDNPHQLGLYEMVDDPISLTSKIDQNTENINLINSDISNIQNTISTLTNLDASLIDGVSSIALGYIENPNETGSYFYGVVVGNSITYSNNPTDDKTFPGDSRTYRKINSGQTFSLNTTEQIQIWVDGERIGWYNNSDGKMYTIAQNVQSSIQIQDWEMTVSGGFGIKYIGAPPI